MEVIIVLIISLIYNPLFHLLISSFYCRVLDTKDTIG